MAIRDSDDAKTQRKFGKEVGCSRLELKLGTLLCVVRRLRRGMPAIVLASWGAGSNRASIHRSSREDKLSRRRAKEVIFSSADSNMLVFWNMSLRARRAGNVWVAS